VAKAPRGPEPALVALHRERQLTRDHLTEGYAQGYLEGNELERRLELAERASTLEELRGLTTDLVAHPPAIAVRPASASRSLAPVPDEVKLSAVFSELHKTGPWTLGRTTVVRSLFASTRLDLREARIPPGVTELRVQVTFAELEVLVPPGVEVEVSCRAAFAEVKQEGGEGTTDPEAPRIIVTGRVLFGAMYVRERLPGESPGAARRRLKAAATARGQARLLPPGQR
jgi:hypothetical protein